jgi:Right handed beta helix region
MNTRRKILSGALALAGTAGPLAAHSAATGGAAAPGGAPYPQSAAEAAASIVPAAYEHPPGDVRRYGVTANDPRAASANARALRALVAPTGTFTGKIWFPNASGTDIYFLNDVIAFHDDIHVDLQASTLEFAKEAVAADANSGFIFAVRNFSIENGSIVVKYNMGAVAPSAGSAIHIGNRGTDSTYFSPAYDSLLKSPMGNITIRNLRITSSVPNGNAIEMTGGLVGVIIENVWIDGQSLLSGGIYYEFGWATPGTTNLRQTSHAHNMRFSNINVTNLQTRLGAAVTLAGAYNCLIDGLYVSGAVAAFNGTSGESLFYRPWAGVDQVGAKHTIALRNIVAHGLVGTALTLGGAQRADNGYLAARNLSAAAQTDLGDYSVDGFALEGAATGWGIYTSAAKADIRNGRISGFQRGIVQGDDCTRLLINAVDVIGCAQSGLQLDIGAAIWDPPRQKMGEIRNCFIAGNGSQRAGVYPAIELDNCAGILIENNRIGYELGHDGLAETTQGNAVQLGARCTNVICRDNYVGGVHGEGVAYYHAKSDDARGNMIQNPGGIATSRGSWGGITVRRRVVAFAASITLDATGSEQYDITATSHEDFVINAPVNPVADKTVTITVRNASGGALGRAAWNEIFKMSPWTNPANGHNRSVLLCFDGTHWLQILQAGVDVPN